MANMATVEIKAFLPARDYELSKRFYVDLGFTVAWASEDLAYLHAGRSSFLLSKFYQTENAVNRIPHYFSLDIFQRLQRWRTERCLRLIVTWTAGLTEGLCGSIVAGTVQHFRTARPSGGANCI